MGLLVVNASAIAAVIFGEDERASVARRLAGQLLLAPSLIAFELMNIAVKRCRAGLLTPDQASASFAEFSIFGVELHEIDMALCLRAVLEHPANDDSSACPTRRNFRSERQPACCEQLFRDRWF